MALATPVATASLYATIATTALSIQQQRSAARRSRQVSRRNALIANQRAADALRRSGERMNARRGSMRQLLGKQRALVGGSGAQIGSESVRRIQDDVVMLTSIDIQKEKNNGLREAAGHRTQAQSFLLDSDSRSEASIFGTIGSAFTGASQAAGTVFASRDT
jgi:FlaA1/EpsC-like NDP-sugar epimerase